MPQHAPHHFVTVRRYAEERHSRVRGAPPLAAPRDLEAVDAAPVGEEGECREEVDVLGRSEINGRLEVDTSGASFLKKLKIDWDEIERTL